MYNSMKGSVIIRFVHLRLLNMAINKVFYIIQMNKIILFMFTLQYVQFVI